MIFVDTGAWFAHACSGDAHHEAARGWLAANREGLVTTDLVAVETVNLIRARVRGREGHALCVKVGGDLLGSRATTLVHVSEPELRAALALLERRADKGWSLTDCTSFAVMQRMGIREAFAFDRHFDQMPGIRRAP